MFNLRSPIDTFISATKGVLLSPVRFFRSISWISVSWFDSLVYAYICGIAAELFKKFLLPTAVLPSQIFRPYIGMFPFAGIEAIPIFLLLPLYSLFYLVIMAFTVYLVGKVVFKRYTSYPAVLSALAAVSATQLFSWIPVIGGLIALYAIVLVVIAIREVYAFSTGKAIPAFILSIILVAITTGLIFAYILKQSPWDPYLLKYPQRNFWPQRFYQ